MHPLITGVTGAAALTAATGWTLTARALHHRTHALTEQSTRVSHLERDGLTGLLRRDPFERSAPAALAASNAIALLDLDRFKSINDTYGHPVGDRVLGAIAGRLVAELGPTALIARQGGDEFVMITELDFPAVHEQLEHLTRVLTAPILVPGVGELTIGVSLGVVWLYDLPSFDDPHTDPDTQPGGADAFWTGVLSEGLAAADTAMYAAKSLRHDWCLYDRALPQRAPVVTIDPVHPYHEDNPALRKPTVQRTTG